MSEEVRARETAPFVVMATKKVVKLEPKHLTSPPVAAELTGECGANEQDAAPKSAEEARRAAKQVVFQSAATMARDLISKSGGNYLAVRFLFEFAGLIGDTAEASSQPSPLLRYYLEGIRNTKPVSSEANNEAKSESV